MRSLIIAQWKNGSDVINLHARLSGEYFCAGCVDWNFGYLKSDKEAIDKVCETMSDNPFFKNFQFVRK